jgi:1-deoxy-D-xylulose-5-phosphate reductoisomerase
MQNIAILGSTGSIGTQALEVIAQNSGRFEVYALTANNNVDLLTRQALQFMPEVAVIANENHYAKLKENLAGKPIKVFAGSDAIAQVAEMDTVDTVLTAMVGFSGLAPTIQAACAGKKIALANKETLVVAGELIDELVRRHNAAILPVDSEHSAIFQCLAGEGGNPVEKLLLTASGGPFRQKTLNELKKVTSRDALKHPNWNMGAKITIDSATMLNKGFEVIEAKWLFGVQPSQIEVVVHPQSIVHSMVQFADGSIKAQLGLPDMKLPIQYALTYPDRIKTAFPRLDFAACLRLDFEKPDTGRFRCLSLAYGAMERGGNMPCVLNAANEIAVAGFLNGKTGFLHISEIIENVMAKAHYIAKPNYEDYLETDNTARQAATEEIKKHAGSRGVWHTPC